jgi:Family of unknown function (DUF6064)
MSSFVDPFLWSLLGSTAAYLFGVYEDLGLLAGLIVSTLLYMKRERSRRQKRNIGGAIKPQRGKI